MNKKSLWNFWLKFVFLFGSIILAVFFNQWALVVVVFFFALLIGEILSIIEKSGIVIYENCMPREISQVIRIIHERNFKIALVLNNKGELVACRSLEKDFKTFVVQREPGNQFFVPTELAQAKKENTMTNETESSVKLT